FCDKLTAGSAEVIFAQTPFYAEMGGQVADTGWILDEKDQIAAIVTNVQKAPNGQYLHQVEIERSLVKGSSYHLQVDSSRHNRIIKNHTATHLLHKALKEVLGEHANQAGSLVEASHL